MTVTVQKATTLDDKTWERLLKRIDSGNCTPFLGAEIGFGEMPAASEIAAEWRSKYDYPLEKTNDISRIAQYMAVTMDPMMPKEEIQRRLGKVKVPDFRSADDPHGVLADLPLPIFVTTNYDDFMARALTSRRKDVRREWCRWLEDDSMEEPSIFAAKLDAADQTVYKPNVANPLVFHLYGHLDAPRSLVLTEDDYLDFLVQTSRDQTRIPPCIQRAFGRASLLFLGYRTTDMDFRVLFRVLSSYLKIEKRRHVSVQVIAQTELISKAQIEQAQKYLALRYGKYDIDMCWITSREFVTELKQRWEDPVWKQKLN